MSDVFQSLLGRGDVCFGAEDVATLVAGFESALEIWASTTLTTRRHLTSPG
jgi:hypothetical protein